MISSHDLGEPRLARRSSEMDTSRIASVVPPRSARTSLIITAPTDSVVCTDCRILSVSSGCTTARATTPAKPPQPSDIAIAMCMGGATAAAAAAAAAAPAASTTTAGGGARASGWPGGSATGAPSRSTGSASPLVGRACSRGKTTG